MSQTPPPVVIGAGWSGLACAIALVHQGHRPVILDAAPQGGGRARAFERSLGGATVRLDNGQHLLLGAYRDTLEAMQTVGVDTGAAFARVPFCVAYPDGWRLAAAPLPAPLHLAAGVLAARGMTVAQRWSLVRWTRRHAGRNWQIAQDAPASQLFLEEPADLVRRLWRPLCLAALNVELDHASARLFLTVLRDSLGGSAGNSHLLLARRDLSALFPDAAVAWLRSRGAQVRFGCTVQGLQLGGSSAPHMLALRDGVLPATQVVLALPADRAAALLTGVHPGLADAARMLAQLRFAPIATCYLRYAPGTRLARPMLALLDDQALGEHGQWVFDRGAMDPALDGVVSVVISGDGPHRALDREALGASVACQLTRALGLPQPAAHYSVIDKHATLAPHPGIARPATRLPVAGLYLAGDAADSPYPSTIEGSVRAGLAAARAIG